MTVAVRSRAETAELIRAAGLIPVIRADSPDTACRVAETLVESGLTVIEITMTVPSALDAIATLSRRLPANILVGAGTVTDSLTVRAAVAAGATFIISPCLVPEVIDAAVAADVTVLPGAATPTEIFDAAQRGADFVKVFPAALMGGPAYFRALRGPFPDIPLVPSGGVTLESIAGYFSAGASAVGVGGEMISRAAVQRGDFAGIGVLATQFLRAVKSARAG